MIGFLLSMALAQTVPSDGFLFSKSAIEGAANSGGAWDEIVDKANDSTSTPSLMGNHDDPDDVRILAKALLYVWNSSTYSTYGTDVETFVEGLYGTFNHNLGSGADDDPSDGLRAARSLFSYVLAWNYVDIEGGVIDSSDRSAFQTFLTDVEAFYWESGNAPGSRTLKDIHEDRPNNWGTMAGASRIVIDMSQNDTTNIASAKDVLRAWCGNLTAHPNYVSSSVNPFDFGDSLAAEWQHTSNSAVFKAVGPVAATFYKDTSPPYDSADGCLPEEMRRWTDPNSPRCSGQADDGTFTFTWKDPFGSCASVGGPPQEQYCYEGLQGAVAQAMLLDRCTYNPWTNSSDALLRAVEWLFNIAAYAPVEDSAWIIIPIDAEYSTSWGSSTDFSNYKVGRAMIGVEWVNGY